MSTVYLAGPISGKSYRDAVGWREYATKRLAEHGITGISPMRMKVYLGSEPVLKQSYEEHVLSSAKGITARDRWDSKRCDVLLANLAEAKRDEHGQELASIGTVMEIAWAEGPVVLVAPDGSLHRHAMLVQTASFVVTTLDEGIAVCIALLAQEV